MNPSQAQQICDGWARGLIDSVVESKTGSTGDLMVIGG